MAKKRSSKSFSATDQVFNRIETLQAKKNKSLKASIKTGVEVTSFADLDRLKEQFPKIVSKASQKTIKLVAVELEAALDRAMMAKAWQWDYGDGDIIDTGELKDSLRLVVDSAGDIYVFYNAEHAAIVHYGGYIHPYGNPRVQIYMPARPWITSVLNGGGPVDKFDFEGVYERIFVPELKNLMKSAGIT